MIRFGSVCSGIEAASVAWHPLGWRAAWLAEIEAFPSAVLAHHYPDTPNLGDMTTIARRVLVGEVEAPELLVGGTPCQAFSVAGLREGLADERGALTIKYVELADAIDFIRRRRGEPEAVIVWENVPGVLSSRDNAFGCFLGALSGEDCELQPAGKKWTNAGCVFGPARAVAWRVIDAQYFGVAQRRRRVFVVASARKGFDPASVLFEFDGVRRDSAPSREAGEEITGALASSLGRRCGVPDGGDTPGLLQPIVGTSTWPVSHCLNAGGMGRIDFETETMVVHGDVQCVTGDITHTLKAEGFDASEDGTGRGQPIVPVLAFSCKDYGADAGDLSPTLRAMGHSGSHANAGGQVAVAYPLLEVGKRTGASTSDPRAGMGIGDNGDPMFTLQASAQHGVALTVALRGRDGGATAELGDDVAGCLRASSGGGDKPHVLAQMRVRRLMPIECERLQGFQDGYTDVPFRGKPAADGPRYKAIGNSKAVPCVAWLGQRIDAALKQRRRIAA
ncbi:DNA cytosine methyltransferase [Chromobacterium phragmitis]|uniref:DNA cytosine methyltransferase n=1 Tax=Chromobacterium amazonense TaxID=1382803 RepID=UPI0021B78B5B|nr:DNA cytosine methyltransferase [Chromobacterium amazonense]MBM2884052.1 DNA cytosine methyltransferase [Chromobacterium amazonense]